MKIVNRNQIIILVIALMLVTAGYLNYTNNQETNIIATSASKDEIEYAGIGDAKLVSSNGVIETNETAIVSNDELIENVIARL